MRASIFKWVTGAAIGATLFATTPVAQAQSSSPAATTISPPSYELTGAQGEVITKTFQVHNTSNFPQTYTFEVNQFVPQGEEGSVAFFPANNRDLAGWITVAPSSITVPPDEVGRVQIMIRVPSSAVAGGHYATVFAVTQGKKPVSGSGMGIGYMVGANVLLNIAGDVVESASVVDFSTPRARVIPGEQVGFTVRVKNNGNTHIKPQGVAEIYRGNIKVDEVLVNPEGGNVLPDSIRKFTATSNKTLTPGPYRAQLSLRYGAGQSLTTDPITFVVIGETSLAAIVAMLLGLFVLILIAALLMNRKKSPPMGGGKMGKM